MSKRDLIRQTLYPSTARKSRSRFQIGYGGGEDGPNTQLVKREKYDNEYNDNDDDDNGLDETDDEDADDGVVNLGFEKPNECRDNSQTTTPIRLPGGMAGMSTLLQQQNHQGHIGEMPQDLVVKIRNYIDILFSSVMLQSRHVIQTMPKADSTYAIPGVVVSILQYNNVEFRTVKYVITSVDLPEPVWYTIDVPRNELILYINDGMYGAFCSKNNVLNVNFTSGIIPLELHNPLVDVAVGIPIDWSMIHCAIVADHVAQHILSDIFGKLKVRNADIHENFANHGTTLHSMFRIEQICRHNHPVEINNYISLLPTMPMYHQQQQQQQQYCGNSRYVQPINSASVLNELMNGYTSNGFDLVSAARPPPGGYQSQAPLPDFNTWFVNIFVTLVVSLDVYRAGPIS